MYLHNQLAMYLHSSQVILLHCLGRYVYYQQGIFMLLPSRHHLSLSSHIAPTPLSLHSEAPGNPAPVVAQFSLYQCNSGPLDIMSSVHTAAHVATNFGNHHKLESLHSEEHACSNHSYHGEYWSQQDCTSPWNGTKLPQIVLPVLCLN